MTSNGTFGGAAFDVAMGSTLADLLAGTREAGMRSRDEIDAIVAARCAAMDTTNGAHDATVALAARKRRGDTAIRWELRAVGGAPYAYAVAYLDTVLRAVSGDA